MAKNPIPKEAETPQKYVAQAKFWYGQRLLAKGDTIMLTAAQAKYYVPQQLKPDAAKAAPNQSGNSGRSTSSEENK